MSIDSYRTASQVLDELLSIMHCDIDPAPYLWDDAVHALEAHLESPPWPFGDTATSISIDRQSS